MMKKYKVVIREVIEHTFEVEEFNEYMAKQVARVVLENQQSERVLHDHKDISCEEIKKVTLQDKRGKK